MTVRQTEMAAQIETPITYLRPSHGWSALNLRDLWNYRELVYFLTWRDLKVRYKQTLLGASWAILKPFMTMVVLSIFFGGLAQVPSENVPYPIFSFVALLPWELFANGLSVASRSLVQNSNMITKVYFPRLILPLASVLAGVVDFAIAFLILIGMMIFYRITPTANVWTLPLFLLLAVITALGVSLWLSALNVQYRDIGYVTPFLTQFWMFISPVAYGTGLLADKVPGMWVQIIYAVNPMVGVINGFRWALLGIESAAPGPALVVSVVVSLALLVSGMFYFRRMERQFADMV